MGVTSLRTLERNLSIQAFHFFLPENSAHEYWNELPVNLTEQGKYCLLDGLTSPNGEDASGFLAKLTFIRNFLATAVRTADGWNMEQVTTVSKIIMFLSNAANQENSLI